MQIQDPEATEEELAIDFERKYGEAPNAELMDEEAFKKASAKYNRILKTDGKSALDFLGSLKNEIKFPELPKNSFTATELSKEVEGLMGEYSKALNSNELTDVTYKIEDRQQGVALDFSYKVTKEDNADIQNTNYFTWFDTRYGQGDQINGKQLAEDMFKLKNFEQIVKSAALKGFNEGVLSSINKQSNASEQPVVGRTTPSDQAKLEAFERFLLS
jgi:predicted ribosome quality control (RQC) complex YloA/Tae2 family protein